MKIETYMTSLIPYHLFLAHSYFIFYEILLTLIRYALFIKKKYRKLCVIEVILTLEISISFVYNISRLDIFKCIYKFVPYYFNFNFYHLKHNRKEFVEQQNMGHLFSSVYIQFKFHGFFPMRLLWGLLRLYIMESMFC